MNSTTNHNELNSRGKFNRAAIRRFALEVSEKARAGKFTRVSEDFVNRVEADIEAEIRRLTNAPGARLNIPVEIPDAESFLTGEGNRVLSEGMRQWAGRAIQYRVQSARGGKTL